uniref:Uncharacterized protein n=1 Tax=Coccidioides posadasii RMSCC 3488 TaxID=454284 RepID=A0A0J6FER4_COCPO|nr:hypothetical protein CPAG_07914 [Coccidioides posadasii RMSCC 3488]
MGNPNEAEAATTEQNDTAPPPYSPCEPPSQPFSTCQHLSPVAHFSMNQSVSPYHPFPTALSAYYQWKITRVFHLGDSTNHKLYTASTHAGISSKGPNIPCVVLYNGPSDKDPALAVVSEQKGWNLKSPISVITLPPLTPSSGPGLNLTIDPAAQGDTSSVTEIMRASVLTDRKTVVFRFSIEVGRDGFRRERFEWRKLKTDDPDYAKRAVKLLRFRSSPTSASSKDGSGAASFEGNGSDGWGDGCEVEVVAVFEWKPVWSMNKPFNIRFMGSGKTGELGDRWAVMAIITGMRIWFLDSQNRTIATSIE